MITIKSHFAFSGINIPSTINCSINSYFKDDQLIQQIDFPTIQITEPLGQSYIKIIINNNLKTLDNNLTESQKYPNDPELASETVELYHAIKQLNKYLFTNNQTFDLESYNPTIQNLINNLDSGEEEFDEFLQNEVYQYIHNFIDNLTKLTGLHAIPVNNTQLKIYQHPRMGDTLTYHQSDFNYYITYSQYLD